MSTAPVSEQLHEAPRKELLRLAQHEEDIAAREAEPVNYWQARPITVAIHRLWPAVNRFGSFMTSARRRSANLKRIRPMAALLVLGALLNSSCSEDGDPVESADLADQPIVFTSDRAGTPDLWVMDPNGARQAQLTNEDGGESSPEWSPDGTRVAFAADRGDGATDIYVVDADGGHLRQVTDTDACEDHPSWSPDGNRLLVVSASDCEDELTAALVVMGSDGSDPQQVIEAPALWPDWSPDGRRIVYTGPNAAGDDTLIWISDHDGSNAAPLDLPDINSPSEPSWSHDGKLIAFVSPTDTYGHENPADWNEDVYVMSADGTNVERVTTSAGNDHWPPAWSPDGRTIVYTSDGTEAEQGDLMAIDLGSRKVTRLTDTDSNDLLADWK